MGRCCFLGRKSEGMNGKIGWVGLVVLLGWVWGFGGGMGCSREIPVDQFKDAAVGQEPTSITDSAPGAEMIESSDSATGSEAGEEARTQDNEPGVEREPADIPPVPKYPVDGYVATVVHVTDGDTLYLVMQPGGWASRVRLKGVNAPECTKANTPGSSFQHCTADKDYFGLDSYKILNQLMIGNLRKVKIACTMKGEFCELDEFDRHLVYLTMPDNRDVGETILAAGSSWSFTRYANDKVATYCRAEAMAIRNKLGMWQQGRPTIKQKMSTTVYSWYYKDTPNHDKICSDAMKESFAKVAGE